MGIFSSLRERAMQRQPPAPFTEDVKAHVLGEYPPPPSAFARERPPPGMETFAGPTQLPELPAPPEPLRKEEPHGEPLRREGKGVEYEILDRLALMEAQLSAIRAQVETVNERLKNVELAVRHGPAEVRAPARFY
jgi:hypothetical protein